MVKFSKYVTMLIFLLGIVVCSQSLSITKSIVQKNYEKFWVFLIFHVPYRQAPH